MVAMKLLLVVVVLFALKTSKMHKFRSMLSRAGVLTSAGRSLYDDDSGSDALTIFRAS